MEIDMAVEVLEVCTEVKRSVETWRQEEIQDTPPPEFEEWVDKLTNGYPSPRGMPYRQLAAKYEEVVEAYKVSISNLCHRASAKKSWCLGAPASAPTTAGRPGRLERPGD